MAGVLAWLAVIALLWMYAWFRLGGIDLRALDDDVEPLGVAGVASPAGTVTVLVALTESRDPTRPVVPDLAAPVALVQVGGGRTDAAVLLLPLEMQLTVEGHGGMDVGEVHQSGGTDSLVQAVLDYTGVNIDHVVALTIDALPELAEIVGTIELCMPEGCRPATGAEVRESLRDSDPERVVRTVAGALRGVATVLETRSAMLSPLAAKRAIDVVATQIDTDVSLRGRELARVAGLLSTSLPLSVDAVPMLRHPVSGEIIPLDEAAAIRFQHLREGTPLQPRDLSEELESLSFAGVRVAVLNGAGIAGLAGRVEAELVAEGLNSIGTGNAPAFERELSLVTYRGGDTLVELAAIMVAELLDGAELERADRPLRFEGDGVDILVTAGAHLDD